LYTKTDARRGGHPLAITALAIRGGSKKNELGKGNLQLQTEGREGG